MDGGLTDDLNKEQNSCMGTYWRLEQRTKLVEGGLIDDLNKNKTNSEFFCWWLKQRTSLIEKYLLLTKKENNCGGTCWRIKKGEQIGSEVIVNDIKKYKYRNCDAFICDSKED